MRRQRMVLVYLPALLVNACNSGVSTTPDKPTPPTHTPFGTRQKTSDNLPYDSIGILAACEIGHDLITPDRTTWVAETMKAWSARIPWSGPSISIYQDGLHNTSADYILISPRLSLLSELGCTTGSKRGDCDAPPDLVENRTTNETLAKPFRDRPQGVADQLYRTLLRENPRRCRGSTIRQGEFGHAYQNSCRTSVTRDKVGKL